LFRFHERPGLKPGRSSFVAARRLVTGIAGTFRRTKACYHEEKATLPVESLPYISAQITRN
jgi:hypothetical protein